MRINLNKKDYREVKKLLSTMENNVAIANMFLEFCSHYDFIDKDAFLSKKDKCKQFAKEFLNFFDLKLETKEDQELFNKYIVPAIVEIDINIAKNNAYYKMIKPQIFKNKKYALEYKKYHALQPFVYEDVKVDQLYYQEISSVAFSAYSFPYLVLAKDNVNWMSITPNEIITMQKSVDEAKGNVITFGLGLGYYAFMVSEKENVESVSIVESDSQIIKIFEENILPLFNHKEKIKIIKSDAFAYCQNNNLDEKYDYAFIDIWHSAEDGLPLYLKFKKYEKCCKKCIFSYWLEESLISLYRRLLLVLIKEQLECNDEANYKKAKNELDKIINNFYFATKELEINSYEEIHLLLSKDNLRKMIEN